MSEQPLSVPRLVFYLLLALALALAGVWVLPRPSAWSILVCLFIGWLVWTLVEYILHRFFFHPWGAQRGSPSRRSLLRTHGRHHHVPGEIAVGFWHPVYGGPALLLFGLLAYGLAGGYGLLGSGGFIGGYVGYMLLHYAIHRRAAPALPGLAGLWRHHLFHHDRDPQRCYGVSTVLWDRVFGTGPTGNQRRADGSTPDPGPS